MGLMCEETKGDKERAGVHETCVCGQASRDTRVLHHVSREFGRIGRCPQFIVMIPWNARRPACLGEATRDASQRYITDLEQASDPRR